jgi:hypothetical protein
MQQPPWRTIAHCHGPVASRRRNRAGPGRRPQGANRRARPGAKRRLSPCAMRKRHGQPPTHRRDSTVSHVAHAFGRRTDRHGPTRLPGQHRPISGPGGAAGRRVPPRARQVVLPPGSEPRMAAWAATGAPAARMTTGISKSCLFRWLAFWRSRRRDATYPPPGTMPAPEPDTARAFRPWACPPSECPLQQGPAPGSARSDGAGSAPDRHSNPTDRAGADARALSRGSGIGTRATDRRAKGWAGPHQPQPGTPP